MINFMVLISATCTMLAVVVGKLCVELSGPAQRLRPSRADRIPYKILTAREEYPLLKALTDEDLDWFSMNGWTSAWVALETRRIDRESLF